jgi:phosphohistidine phosphatase
MAKFLYLLRHAQSADKELNQSDRDRDLTANGFKQCSQISAWILNNNLTPDMIFTSSAVRTVSTTKLISDAIKFPAEKISYTDDLYNASTRTFLDFITTVDPYLNSIMCVGHNPTISYLTEYLTKAIVGDMAPCGLAIIKFDSQWREISEGTGTLVEYTQPSTV